MVQLKWGKGDAVRRMRREEAATGAGEREIEKERLRKRERERVKGSVRKG